MASTSDIKKHVKPGKGPAFVRTKLKSVTTGKVIDNTFSAGHKIEDVRVETRSYQYLYPEGETYHFMNTDDYNQITLQRETLDAPDLLKEGEVVKVLFNTEDSMPLSVEMPASVVLEVTESEPGVKGNTATNATKPATVETGARINVPLFINEGDKIKVDTEKGAYLERVKE
jgi:elongation factor P